MHGLLESAQLAVIAAVERCLVIPSASNDDDDDDDDDLTTLIPTTMIVMIIRTRSCWLVGWLLNVPATG